MSDLVFPFTLGPDSIVHGPCPRPKTLPAPRVHVLSGDADPYGATQCDEAIQDGDVLICGEVVAVMVSAWPVSVCGDGESIGFHALADDADTSALGAYRFGRSFGGRTVDGVAFTDHSNATGGADYSKAFDIARRLMPAAIHCTTCGGSGLVRTSPDDADTCMTCDGEGSIPTA